MPQSQAFDVFLSYNKTDEGWTKKLKSALVSRNLRVWLACDEIGAGELFPSAIEEGMLNSGAVVLIVSPESLASKWVEQEYNSALTLSNKRGHELPIIPVILRTAELPPFLESRMFVDFRDEAGFEVGVNALAASIRAGVRGAGKRIERVTFISSEYPPCVFGGLGIHVQKLTAALAGLMEVEVLLPNPMPEGTLYEQPPANVRPAVVPVTAQYTDDPSSWCRFALNAIPRLLHTAESQWPAIVHCHDWVTVLAGIKCRWHANVPLVFHVHLPNRDPLCASIENLALISADMVTVNSEFMSVELTDRGLPIRKLRVVKNGVDTDIFRPSPDWPADDGYILFVGRLVEQKGVEYLLRAFSYVHQKFPDVRLKILGHGEFEAWLERLAANLMLSSHVEFLKWVPHEQTASLYQRARLVVVPSVFEPFGMVALEAMACKRPVVASRIGGLREIVQHGKTGFLVHPKDHLDLAQWMMTLLSDAELRQKMGEASHAAISAGGYTWPAIAQSFYDLYVEARDGFERRNMPTDARRYMGQIVGQTSESNRWNWRQLLENLYTERVYL
ncbi:MAG: glycosyltransferase [Acidobacteriaceae bacterium]|nr:glycosyltransferase [Acidobacteriaceae bacterium]